MGALRARNGFPEPYNVKYWEIGNEVWGQWQVGTCTAEQFAKRTISFAKAMKEADASIVPLACGHYEQEWNKAVLDLAGEYMDYLTSPIYHGYGPFGMNRDTPAEERYKAIASYPEWTRHHIRKTTELIRSQSKHSHVKLAITEYNTMYYPNTVRKGAERAYIRCRGGQCRQPERNDSRSRHGAYRQFLRSCEWLARRMHTGRGLLRGSVLRQGARMERASAHDIRDADL